MEEHSSLKWAPWQTTFIVKESGALVKHGSRQHFKKIWQYFTVKHRKLNISNKALPLNPLSVWEISMLQLFEMTVKCVMLKQERKRGWLGSKCTVLPIQQQISLSALHTVETSHFHVRFGPRGKHCWRKPCDASETENKDSVDICSFPVRSESPIWCECARNG